MTERRNPIGQVFHARDGGLHAPLDRGAFDRIQAQASTSGRKGQMEVSGVGYRYGIVGWFPFYGAMRVEPGAFIEAPGRHRKYRDALGLYSHDSAAVLARVGNNTLDLVFGEEELSFSMRLNPEDPLAQAVWARLMREDVNASSVGMLIIDGDWEEGYDNSLDADPEAAGEKIDIFAVTKAELLEVSLVAQGAFAGATSAPAEAAAERFPEVAVAAAVIEGETIDEAVKNALPAEAAIVGDDGDAEDDTGDATGASASPSGDDTGDDAGGSGEVDGGPAPDGERGSAEQEEAVAEAERQGMTLKELVGRTPYDLTRRLSE